MQPAREQSIRQKIGSIFNLGTPRATPQPQKNHEEFGKQDHNTIFITEDVLRELDCKVPTQQRVRAMKELHDIVSTKRLEEHAVKSIWLSIQDLIDPSQPTDVRHTALVFIKALIYGQFDDLGILRAHFFHVIRTHNVHEDMQERFDILRELTRNGKNILNMEQDIGRFLLEWMPEFMTSGKAVTFISFLVNFVHYNAAYLDQDVLIGLVQLCCVLANKSTLPNVISLCLDFMNAVVCYSSLPADSLHTFVVTLCNTLNIERFSKKSLDVMLRLLGTHLGRSTIYSMCSIIQERSSSQEALLLRGAVFYISMSMWGVRKVNLDLSFASILPSIKQAVLSGHTIVVYEVSLSVLRLVRAHAPKLHPLEWEAIYDIIEAIQDHVSRLQEVEPGGTSRSNLGQCLKDLFLAIEQMYEGGMDIGSPDHFFRLVERSLDAMPVQSVLTLLSYRTSVMESTEDQWVESLKQCMDKFYSRETRTAVRIEALNYLGRVVEDNTYTHERDLMEDVVFPLLEPIARDQDMSVRCHGAQLLIHLLNVTESTWATQILAILSSLLQAGMQLAGQVRVNKSMETPRLLDSKTVVFGLTETFKSKLHSSSPVAAQVFSLLVALILQHYDEKCFLPAASVMRIKILNCILSLRSNQFGQLGYQENESIEFSPFFICRSDRVATPTCHGPTILDYSSAFNAVLICLEKEQEREVLVQVLRDIVPLLQDRTLTLSSMPDLSMLTTHLCDLTLDHTYLPRPLFKCWSRTDVPLHVYPVLAVLSTYPSHMHRQAQESLICCLESGLVGKAAQTCVSSLGLCALELQPTMKRLLPRVLYKLGQIVATPTLAVPVLEFLSGLISAPSLYHGFVDQQYLSVFAIALPYTNHQKYSPYVIALAHRVVAQWFVSCRLQYRPTIARFIMKHLSMDLASMSSPVRSESGVRSEGGVGVELVEVCRDMMARYTYSNASALPHRSSGADFLLVNGLSKTWSVGNFLVTITTSRGKDGECKQCQSTTNQSAKSSIHGDGVDGSSLCSCMCRGWAEVMVHKPTGDVSWIMRLQNQLYYDNGRGSYDNRRGLLALQIPVQEDELPFNVSGDQPTEGPLNVSGDQPTDGPLNVSGDQPTEGPLNVSGDQPTEGPLNVSGDQPTDGPLNVSGDQPTEEPLEPLNVSGDQPTEGPLNVSGDQPTEEPLNVSGDQPTEGPLNVSGDQPTEEPLNVSGDQPTDEPLNVSGDQPTDGPLERENEYLTDKNADSAQSKNDELESILEGEVPQPVLNSDLSPLQSSNSSESEFRGVAIPTSSHQSDYTTMASLEHLPPLLSYDDQGEPERSPSLHETDNHLSEEDQLKLYVSLSNLTPPCESDHDTLSETSSDDSSDNEVLSWKQDPTPLRPRLKHQSQSLPEESPSSLGTDLPPPPSTTFTASLAPPPTTLTPSPALQRRQSAPSTPQTNSPAQRKKKMVHQTPYSIPFQTDIGTHTVLESEEQYDPSFVFLQLYHSSALGRDMDTPLLLPSNESVDRAVKMLTHIPPYETHKIGVLYIAPGQSSESEILANTFGSSRYLEFLRGLGSLLRLPDVRPGMFYLGGLDQSGTDGKVTYCYRDNISQVVFHVATLMPTDLTSDPKCSCKKLHIGNDFVTIVYNDSGSKYKFGTITGQFNFAEVVIVPCSGGMNRVIVRGKPEVRDLLVMGEPLFISDSWLPVLVRQKALQADLTSHVHVSETTPAVSEHYLTNWLGRLRQIKRIRDKCRHDDTKDRLTNFTDFT